MAGLDKSYSVTREVASSYLGISTRTIDRYIKSWKLSYKKIANKVLLNKLEINKLKEEFSLLRQEVDSEILGWAQQELAYTDTVSWSHQWTTTLSTDQSAQQTLAMREAFEHTLDQKIEKFFLIFNEKEKQLEDKNRVVVMLQQRIHELELKIQWMMALPDYHEEKKKALEEKEQLEEKIKQLTHSVKSEKAKWMMYISVFILLVVVAMIFFLMQ